MGVETSAVGEHVGVPQRSTLSHTFDFSGGSLVTFDSGTLSPRKIVRAVVDRTRSICCVACWQGKSLAWC